MDKLAELRLVVEAFDCKIAEIQAIQRKYVDEYNAEYQRRLAAEQVANQPVAEPEPETKRKK